MICVEVLVNGEPRTVAGAGNAETIEAVVTLHPELKTAWLQVSGDIAPDNQPPADANWLSTQLAVGDKLEFRVIETNSPVAPTLSRTDPTQAATDEIPLVCAFCGKDGTEAKGMISSRKALICHDCVAYLHELVGEAATPAAD